MEDQGINIRIEDLPLVADGLRALYVKKLEAKKNGLGVWGLGDEREFQNVAELGRRINRRIELAKISKACG